MQLAYAGLRRYGPTYGMSQISKTGRLYIGSLANFYSTTCRTSGDCSTFNDKYDFVAREKRTVTNATRGTDAHFDKRKKKHECLNLTKYGPLPEV